MIKNKLYVKYQQCIDDNEELYKKLYGYAFNALNEIPEYIKILKFLNYFKIFNLYFNNKII